MSSAAPTWLRQDPALADAGWRHGWSTLAGPDFVGDPGTPRQGEAVAVLCRATRLRAAAWVHQVHGGSVLHATGPGCLGAADALWSDQPGLGVVGRGADCPLILVVMSAPVPRWGFAHASWRATVRGVTTNLLAAMVDAGGDATSARAVICPSAGPCCYEVGSEVRDEALARLGSNAGVFFPEKGGRLCFDLWRANTAQLVAGGIPTAAICVTGICTICAPGFHSWRRDGTRSGRCAAIVGHQ